MENEHKTRNAKIFIRILPGSDFSYENIKVESDFKTLHVRCLQDFLPGKDSACDPPEYWRFATDGVFFKTTQEDVYSSVLGDVLNKVLCGAEALIICHGQAGSGKSYTSFGITSEFEERGLAPRLIAALFDEKRRRPDNAVQITMSCVELLGQELVDLLQTEGRQAQAAHMENVLSVPVESEEDAIALLFEAVGQRSVCNEAPYLGANRGHGVLTVRVVNNSSDKTRPIIASGMLHLVDLAGINSPAKNSWSKPQDIGTANLTKTFMEQVLILMAGTCDTRAMLSQKLVCPVVRYVGSALSNAAILRFIGHICGSRKDLDLTLSTLRFSERVRALKCSGLKFNTEPHPKLVLENFEDEVASLTKQLEESTMLAHETNWTNISQARIEHMRRLVMSFLEGKSSPETIMALQQTPLAIMVFKEELDKLKAETATVQYKIDNLQFDDFQKPQSRRQSRNPSSVSSLGKRGKSSGHSASLSAMRGSSLASRELKKKGGDSKETMKKQAKSPKESPDSINRGSVTTSKEKLKQRPPSKEKLKSTPSITLTAGKSSNMSSKHLKRVGSQANKKSSQPKVKGKSKEGMSKLDELPPDKLEPCVVDETPEVPIVLPSAPIPPHENAWEAFVKTDVAEMQAAVNQAQLDSEQAHIAYSQAVVKLTEARQALALSRGDVMEAQRERLLHGREAYDAEGRIVTDETEQTTMSEYRRREATVAARLETLKVGKVELDECVQRLVETKRALEDRFEEFCLATYQAPIPHVELDTRDLEKPKEHDDITEHRIKYFHMLQQMFFSSPTMCNKERV